MLKVALVGAVLGTAISLWSMNMLATLLHGVTATDPMTLLSAVVGALALGVVAAAVPALRASRADPVVALRTE